MSSSSTETLRRRRRCPRWACRSPRAPSSSGRSRSATGSRPTRSSPRSRPTRSTPTSSRPPPAACRRSLVEVGETVDVGTVLARIATDAKPGEAHVSENDASSRRARARPRPRSRRPARPASCRATPRAARRGCGRGGPAAPLLAGRDADRRRARRRPRAGRGHRPRRPRAQAGRAGVRGERRRGGEEPPMHIESPYRPDEPAPPKTRKPRFEAPAAEPAPAAAGAAPPLSRMRQAIGARMLQSLQTAATCTTIVEADMIRIEAARAEDRASRTCRTSRARRSRRCASSRRSTPRSRTTRSPRYDGVHLGIAVSLGEGGLIVPVIRDAQELSRRGPGQAHQGPRAPRARERSSRRTRSAAARSRSPTPAATARSSPRR